MPAASPLFADPEVTALFAPERAVSHFIAFEAALTEALSAEERVPADAAKAVLSALRDFTPDFKQLKADTLTDGIPVPSFVRQFKAAVPQASEAFHIGATSQDLMDTSLALSLRDLTTLLEARLETVGKRLTQITIQHGQKPLLARTRMQAALPQQVQDRLALWHQPVLDLVLEIPARRAEAERLQFAGPIGTLRDHRCASHMAKALGLARQEHGAHTARRPLASYAFWLSGITTALGKIGADVALMAQQGLDEIQLKGGGQSSAMAHKQNPIQAEALCTLAHWNAALLPTLLHPHEQERSGTAWALEGLAIPAMAEAAGAALLNADQLLAHIKDIGTAPG